ncbi:hypothetical protein EON65_18755 [archaeon]|nr:MAG: hypothetical protein EON65_18755 [archaeon]
MCLGYQAALDKLRGTLPTEPIHCSAPPSTTHSNNAAGSKSDAVTLPCFLPTRTPQCYTLYQPMHTMHTNSLLNITVGEHDGWIVDGFTAGIDMDKYGYKDHKTYFRGVIGGNALHIKVLNVRFGVVKLFGLGGDRLKIKGIQIVLDPHVPNIKHSNSYTPSNKIVQVNAFAQYDAESDEYEIRGLPKGDHVLTILTPIDTSQTEATSLTHVAVY